LNKRPSGYEPFLVVLEVIEITDLFETLRELICLLFFIIFRCFGMLLSRLSRKYPVHTLDKMEVLRYVEVKCLTVAKF